MKVQEPKDQHHQDLKSSFKTKSLTKGKGWSCCDLMAFVQIILPHSGKNSRWRPERTTSGSIRKVMTRKATVLLAQIQIRASIPTNQILA
jgi:hypothetical protein